MSFDTAQTYSYQGKPIGHFVEYVGFPLNGDWYPDARAKFAYTSGGAYTSGVADTTYTTIDRGHYHLVCVHPLETESPNNVYSAMPKHPIITEIASLADFKTILESNPGAFIVKLGAEWCGPCKKIEPFVYDLINKLTNPNIQCAVIDVDESFELYAFLKSKKMISGIPAILAYYKGNTHYVPDEVVIGADPNEIVNLFNRAIVRVGNA